jgi:hypothetical protein
VIEYTAITATYGAIDQYDHQDVVPPASAAKFGRTFVPSYTLFIPLQDTTYIMGASHLCPGSHLCSENCEVSSDDLKTCCCLHGYSRTSLPTRLVKFEMVYRIIAAIIPWLFRAHRAMAFGLWDGAPFSISKRRTRVWLTMTHMPWTVSS